MRTRKRRLQAWLYYLRRPIRQFLPLFFFALAGGLLGGGAVHNLYDKPLCLAQSIWTTFGAVFLLRVSAR